MVLYILVIICTDNGVLPLGCQAMTLNNPDMNSVKPAKNNIQWNSNKNYYYLLFSCKICIWKCRLQNDGNFVSATVCQLMIPQCLKYASLYRVIIGLDNGLSPVRHQTIPNNKVHVASMGPTWGRQDSGGPHVCHMNLAIWDYSNQWWRVINHTQGTYFNEKK